MAFGFGKERRLLRRADFVHVQTHGERATSRHFVFLVTAREPASPGVRVPSRLGVVATRKVGNAVVRNRIKRVCRECFRLWPSGFVPDGTDLVNIARQGAELLPLGEVESEWARARPVLLKRCESVLRRGPIARTRASSKAQGSTPSGPDRAEAQVTAEKKRPRA